MKFEETRESILLPHITGAIIYFLINGEEVVYVGQSKNGSTRPFSHTTKVFEKVAMIKCNQEDLDYLESMYILKYKPKYNRNILNSHSYSLKNMRRIIREKTYFKKIVINDLKWIIRKFDIRTDSFEGNVYVDKDDFKKIINFIETNRDVIEENEYRWRELLK